MIAKPLALDRAAGKGGISALLSEESLLFHVVIKLGVRVDRTQTSVSKTQEPSGLKLLAGHSFSCGSLYVELSRSI